MHPPPCYIPPTKRPPSVSARLAERPTRAPACDLESTHVDLNYLYFRQQVELARADEAQCSESADAHRHLADLYGSLIESSKEAARSAAA